MHLGIFPFKNCKVMCTFKNSNSTECWGHCSSGVVLAIMYDVGGGWIQIIQKDRTGKHRFHIPDAFLLIHNSLVVFSGFLTVLQENFHVNRKIPSLFASLICPILLTPSLFFPSNVSKQIPISCPFACKYVHICIFLTDKTLKKSPQFHYHI